MPRVRQGNKGGTVNETVRRPEPVANHHRRLWVVGLVAALLLAGCGSDAGDPDADADSTETSQEPSPAPSETEEPSTSSSADEADLHVTAIGDSIPYNLNTDCPGCVGFVDSYAEALGDERGETVDVQNYSRHDGAKTGDIEQELASGALDAPLAPADVVIVSIGFNDQPPYFEPDQPCAVPEPVSAQDAIDAVARTTPTCVDEVTASIRKTAKAVLAQVRAKAPKGAAVAVLVPYDAWNGWEDVEQNPPATRRAVTELITYALVAWRSALCAEAKAVKAACIDAYRDFNGPDGQRPAGNLLAADYTHPSQKGNDRIRDLVLKANLLS